MDLEKLKLTHAATITRAQAAQVLGIDARTVSKGIAEGVIPSFKIGRRILIPKERFLELLISEERQEIHA